MGADLKGEVSSVTGPVMRVHILGNGLRDETVSEARPLPGVLLVHYVIIFCRLMLFDFDEFVILIVHGIQISQPLLIDHDILPGLSDRLGQIILAGRVGLRISRRRCQVFRHIRKLIRIPLLDLHILIHRHGLGHRLMGHGLDLCLNGSAYVTLRVHHAGGHKIGIVLRRCREEGDFILSGRCSIGHLELLTHRKAAAVGVLVTGLGIDLRADDMKGSQLAGSAGYNIVPVAADIDLQIRRILVP